MNYRYSKGLSIIEVLISMVILSIGVLALSILQLSSMQNTQGGHMRSQASMLAYDIIDAMRANPDGVIDGNYSTGFQAAVAVATTCYGAEANCTTEQLAAADLNRWRTVLGVNLPSGQGQIVTAVVPGSAPTATVTVQWTDPYSAEDGAEQVTLQALLQ